MLLLRADVLDLQSAASAAGREDVCQIVAYRGNEEQDNVFTREEVLKSRMVEFLKREANPKPLVWPPEHYKELLFGPIDPPPGYQSYNEAIAFALQTGANSYHA